MTEAIVGTRPLTAPPRLQPVQVVVEASSPPIPRLRGVSHEKAFAFAPALGLLLVVSADGARATIAAAVFAITMTLMLGVSAANHRVALSSRWQPWMRRLDHTTVNLFVAGTWISFAVVLLPGATAVGLSTVVCLGAIATSLVTIVWVHVPGWIPVSIGLAAGAASSFALPSLAAALGSVAFGLFLLGAAFYVVGVIVYALRRPNPAPASVGYHEIFHALVVAGVACHYVTHAFFVLPLAS